MDQLHERLDALEQQVRTLTQHTHTVTRWLRWRRALTCGAVVLSLLSLTLPSGPAVDAQSRPLADRLSALQDTLTVLQDKLQHVTVVAQQDTLSEVVITGANLRIVNGLGRTDYGTAEELIPNCPNGLGNLIVRYGND